MQGKGGERPLLPRNCEGRTSSLSGELATVSLRLAGRRREATETEIETEREAKLSLSQISICQRPKPGDLSVLP